MKTKNKIIAIVILFTLVFSLMACSITTITKIEFVKTPKPVYKLSETARKVEASVKIYYSDGKVSEEVKIENTSTLGLKVTGDTFNQVGKYTLKVSYGSIVVSYQYEVVAGDDIFTEVKVNKSDDLRNLLNNANEVTIGSTTIDKDIPLRIYVETESYDQSTNGVYELKDSGNKFATYTINRSVEIIGIIGANNKKPTLYGKTTFFTSTISNIKSIKLENLNFDGSGLPSTYGIQIKGDNSINASSIKDFTVNNCEFRKFNVGVWVASAKYSTPGGKTTLPKITCENINITNNIFTNVSGKGLYIENGNNIFISGNKFNNGATEPISNTPCVVDINLKYLNYNKVEIINNEFNDSGRIYNAESQELEEISNLLYAAVIAVKARRDIGNSDYSVVPASLNEVIISGNVFNRNFTYYQNHPSAYVNKGVNIIMFGETDKMKDVDGININGITVTNNTINDLGGAITALKWFNKAYATKADAAKDSLGW